MESEKAYLRRLIGSIAILRLNIVLIHGNKKLNA
ncbi:hypothetical protein AsAng_0040340 [Aureispira anguillae]|uniref:Uncharacterized protein n=1 Tax=Aureispira anguillae TaxID=2864201 RepID=A0A916DTK0_9BACT|nr:hypothetical protein AsAng_0040340 [Aureispira anguillae]